MTLDGLLYLMLLAVCIVPLLLLFFVSRFHGWHRKDAPISDEEFLRRCPPGTHPEIALRVRRIISDQLDVPYDQIAPEHRFVKDLMAG